MGGVGWSGEKDQWRARAGTGKEYRGMVKWVGLGGGERRTNGGQEREQVQNVEAWLNGWDQMDWRAESHDLCEIVSQGEKGLFGSLQPMLKLRKYKNQADTRLVFAKILIFSLIYLNLVKLT